MYQYFTKLIIKFNPTENTQICILIEPLKIRFIQYTRSIHKFRLQVWQHLPFQTKNDRTKINLVQESCWNLTLFTANQASDYEIHLVPHNNLILHIATNCINSNTISTYQLRTLPNIKSVASTLWGLFEMFLGAPTTSYLPWNISVQDYPSSYTSSGHLLWQCKVSSVSVHHSVKEKLH